MSLKSTQFSCHIYGKRKCYSIQRYWHNHSQLLSMKMSYTVEGMTSIFVFVIKHLALDVLHLHGSHTNICVQGLFFG